MSRTPPRIPNEQRYQSVSKAIAILNSFTPQTPELSTAEVAQRLGIHRATAFRLLEMLAHAGLIEKSDRTGKYTVGPALYLLGSLYLASKDALREAEPVVKELNDLTGEVVTIGVYEKGYITLVIREESKHHIRLQYHIGSTFPAYVNATGKVSLAELPEGEIDRLYPGEKLPPFTDKTVPTKTALKAELAQIRKNGYVIVREQAREGVSSVGSIIRDCNGKPVAAMAIALPLIRVTEAKLNLFAQLVRLGAIAISTRLGFRNAEVPLLGLAEIRQWWDAHRSVLGAERHHRRPSRPAQDIASLPPEPARKPWATARRPRG
jgi:DNA-binding IclR family transcriptional regulator